MPSHAAMSRAPSALVLVLVPIALGAVFSIYQAGSPLFVCGRNLAGWEVYAWLALSGTQGALFLFARRAVAPMRLYRSSQALLLPVLALVVGQLALAYPRTFVVLGIGAVIYWMGAAGLGRICRSGSRAEPFNVVAAAAETVTFVLAAAVIHSTIAFVVLYSPGRVLHDHLFLAIAALSALIAGILVRRERGSFTSLSIDDVPPLALLLLVLLRAKLPDPAYDSLFYKATLPILIGEWRTALTGIFDHSLVGTNFLEIINSQARIIDREFSPAMGTSLAMAALWLVVPPAARAAMPASLGSARDFAIAGCTLLVVSLTEPLIAAGTAYHEPMLALFMTASLLPMAPAWLFLGAAVASKITVLFAVPVLVFVKVAAWHGERESHGARIASAGPIAAAGSYLRHIAQSRPMATSVCVLLSMLVAGQQFDRNLAQTGRLLAVTEVLSGWTDPDGQILGKQERNPIFDAVSRRGPQEKYGNTLVHVLTLDRWIVPTELGFHVMPTSRLIAVMVLLALLAPLVPALRRRPGSLLLLALWAVCMAATLNFFSQGRHLFPLSFAAAIVVPWVVAVALRDSADSGGGLVVATCLVIAAAALGDQIVGTFINNGWECRRPLRAPVVLNDYDRPTTSLERRLAEIAAQYRMVHQPATGEVPPTILCESPTDRMRYLGVHYVYASASFELTQRRLAARPDDALLVPTSVLAVCFSNAAFFEAAVPTAQRKHFVEVPGIDKIRIMVSQPLLQGARATSLAAARQPRLAAVLNASSSVDDFVAAWSSGRLSDMSRVDAPGGKGAFVMAVEGRPTAVLLSPFGITFDRVQFPEGARLDMEMAMPYSNSDGMAVRFIFQTTEGERHEVQLALDHKPIDVPGPVFARHAIAIPPGVRGEGTLRIEALSSSGDITADWVFFRRLHLVHAGQ